MRRWKYAGKLLVCSEHFHARAGGAIPCFAMILDVRKHMALTSIAETSEVDDVWVSGFLGSDGREVRIEGSILGFGDLAVYVATGSCRTM